MGPIAELSLAAAIFLGTHFVSSTPLRATLVAKLGKGYLALYSLVAIVTLVWMVRAFYAAPFVNLWYEIGLPRVPQGVMPFALIFFVCAVTTPNPTAVGQGKLLKSHTPARGILRVTRHPLMWSFALWAASHMIARGELAAVIFFGAFLVLALAGTILIDLRKAASSSEDWQRFERVTSNIPFVAIMEGRNRLVLGEIGWWMIVLGIALYALLLWLHPTLFGVQSLI
jgi:uncharacterized membrane protein